MIFPIDETLKRNAVPAAAPPLGAYGLAPSDDGYRLADLTCVPGHRQWRLEGAYTQYAVALVLAGAFEYAGGTGSGMGVPGTLILANRREAFAARHISAEGNRRLVLFFHPSLLEDAADDLGLGAARFPTAVAPPSRLTPAITASMLRIAAGRDGSGEEAAVVVEAALGGASGWRGSEKVSAVDECRIVDVVRYINAHFSRPCSLDELAAIAGLSRFRFARRFRAVTGESANRYVLNRRLSAAAVRLVDTKASVLEIACEVGFNDLSHFYQHFRAAFGCAPGAWRRGALH